MSTRHLVLVLTEPTEGNEARFNDYYENTHLREVIATTGFDSAERFKLVAELGEGAPLPYLAVYETHGDSAEEILQDLGARRQEREQSDALNKRTGRVWVYEATGDKHSR
ncbi:MAG: hypothetical protein AAF515_22470 [Pseudomonadota bacterium]